jgi:class 3 adenylate cyclase
MQDVRHWLNSLDLGQYAAAFESNNIEWDILPELDHDALKDVGVSSTGHRLRILKAVKSLKPEHEAPSSERAPVEHPVDAWAGPTGEAERRQLTVMFCDLIGSTALAESIDAEDYRELLTAYQEAARAAIEPFDGYIARYMGDGLLIYFGYPQAHEDDAERAVRAGLGIIESVQRLKAGIERDLAVRIGVATGEVVAGDVIGEGASEERAVLGETPNLAARLQGIASTNALVISNTTRRLVEGRFEVESLGMHDLKGIAAATPAYRALSVRESATRFEARQRGHASPLLGRDSELALLEQRWELAANSEGQVVLLEGEPGIGKSRLIQALRERIGSAAAVVQRYQCSPFRTASAFYPVTELLERASHFLSQDDDDTKLAKLEAAIEWALPGDVVAVALMASLMSLPIDRFPPLGMTALEQRTKSIDVMVAQLVSLSARGPVLMLFEDVHWSDPSTLELLDSLIDRMQSLPVLALVTYRPEFRPPWTRYGHVTVHSLNRLGSREVNGMVANVTGGKSLPEEILAQIVVKTDGVPLFIEELTKTVIEAKFLSETEDRYVLEGPIPPIAIPSTLHDALLARLDRLGASRQLAQIGACIGRTFGYDLISSLEIVAQSKLGLPLSNSWAVSSCSAAVSRPTPDIPSSMPWCRMPRTNPCCAEHVRAITNGSHTCSKRSFRQRR